MKLRIVRRLFEFLDKQITREKICPFKTPINFVINVKKSPPQCLVSILSEFGRYERKP